MTSSPLCSMVSTGSRSTTAPVSRGWSRAWSGEGRFCSSGPPNAPCSATRSRSTASWVPETSSSSGQSSRRGRAGSTTRARFATSLSPPAASPPSSRPVSWPPLPGTTPRGGARPTDVGGLPSCSTRSRARSSTRNAVSAAPSCSWGAAPSRRCRPSVCPSLRSLWRRLARSARCSASTPWACASPWRGAAHARRPVWTRSHGATRTSSSRPSSAWCPGALSPRP